MALVVSLLALTSINLFVFHGVSLTKEEAIEISRNSDIVRSLIANADHYMFEVHYTNGTQANENHTVWLITWYIYPIGAVSAVRAVVSHSIDDVTGAVLDEELSAIR